MELHGCFHRFAWIIDAPCSPWNILLNCVFVPEPKLGFPQNVGALSDPPAAVWVYYRLQITDYAPPLLWPSSSWTRTAPLLQLKITSASHWWASGEGWKTEPPHPHPRTPLCGTISPNKLRGNSWCMEESGLSPRPPSLLCTLSNYHQWKLLMGKWDLFVMLLKWDRIKLCRLCGNQPVFMHVQHKVPNLCFEKHLQ